GEEKMSSFVGGGWRREDEFGLSVVGGEEKMSSFVGGGWRRDDEFVRRWWVEKRR
ncbi:hypothetical protein A2U01_0061330, partial [Trifolium medium]|nr:hypothetical protein [Trifolium medium]